jgi:hypothetical protein
MRDIDDIDTQTDVLAGWVARQERQYRALVVVWGVTAAGSGLLSLMNDDAVFVPVFPLTIAVVWLAVVWGSERYWTVRGRVVGHPLVRADVPWEVATDRPLPLGWTEAPVNGTLHRTSSGWLWCPSRLVGTDLPARFWADEDVAAVTVTPLWSPVLPTAAQVRLYLRGGGSVEILVRGPWRALAG